MTGVLGALRGFGRVKNYYVPTCSYLFTLSARFECRFPLDGIITNMETLQVTDPSNGD